MFRRRVEDLTARYIALWRSTPNDAPKPDPELGPGEQAQCERELESKSLLLKARLRQFPGHPGKRESWRVHLLSQARQLAGSTLKLDAGGLRLFFTNEGLEATREFVREARKFDPRIDDHGLHQALRNLWVVQSLQLLLQRPVALTEPVFAYSMLYPLTDNYLDAPGRTAESKARFCEWLGSRLRGCTATPPDDHAAQVGRLIARIETVFPPAEFVEVWQSLSAIHHAQTDSLRQSRADLPDDTLLELTIRKGGTSVLADAYLVAGQLSKTEADFIFGYGVLLQFMDDLQDFPTDLADGHSTAFSRQATAGCLNELSSRFWHFCEAVLASPLGLEAPALAPVKALLRDNCKLLLLQTIARNQDHFTPDFTNRMERYSPLCFRYIAGRQATLHQEYSDILSHLQRRDRIRCAFDLLI